MMRKSTIRVLLAGAVAAALLAGCGTKDKPPAAAPQEAPGIAHSSGKANGGADTPSQPQAQAPQNKSAAIQTFFGDENGTALVVKQTTITYVSDNDKYTAALNALKQSGDSKAIALLDGFTFKSATLEQGKLKLDLKLDAQGKLGSPAEELTLQALQKVLFQFPEVKEIYVTVDGKKVDSLMGHMDLPYPIKRS